MLLFITINATEEHTKLMLNYTITCAQCHVVQYMSRPITSSSLVLIFQQMVFLVWNRLYRAQFHVFLHEIIVLW